jgi:hypothetical protein
VIADLDLAHAGADLTYDTSALVAWHRRQLARPHALDGRQVRVTQARRGDLDQDFTRTRTVQLDTLDSQGL